MSMDLWGLDGLDHYPFQGLHIGSRGIILTVLLRRGKLSVIALVINLLVFDLFFLRLILTSVDFIKKNFSIDYLGVQF